MDRLPAWRWHAEWCPMDRWATVRIQLGVQVLLEPKHKKVDLFTVQFLLCIHLAWSWWSRCSGCAKQTTEKLWSSCSTTTWVKALCDPVWGLDYYGDSIDCRCLSLCTGMVDWDSRDCMTSGWWVHHHLQGSIFDRLKFNVLQPIYPSSRGSSLSCCSQCRRRSKTSWLPTDALPLDHLLARWQLRAD